MHRWTVLHARKSNSPVANSIFGVFTTGIKNLRETASRSEGEQQLSVRLNCNLISTNNQKLRQRQLVELKVNSSCLSKWTVNQHYDYKKFAVIVLSASLSLWVSFQFNTVYSVNNFGMLSKIQRVPCQQTVLEKKLCNGDDVICDDSDWLFLCW